MDQLQARIDEFHRQITLAAARGDLGAIRTLVAGGPGLAFQSGDEDLLSWVLFVIEPDCPHRHDAIRLLLDLGADPNIVATSLQRAQGGLVAPGENAIWCASRGRSSVELARQKQDGLSMTVMPRNSGRTKLSGDPTQATGF